MSVVLTVVMCIALLLLCSGGTIKGNVSNAVGVAFVAAWALAVLGVGFLAVVSSQGWPS